MAAGDIYSAARLVDGEIVLGCSDPTPVCCLYPWPDPEGNEGGPFYPPEDLPDAIVILGITLNHVVGEYLFLSVDELTNVFAGGEDWIASGAFPLQGTPCLIGDDPGTFPTPIEDEFPDNYAVDWDDGSGPQNATITRVSLCQWVDEVSGWQLDYIDDTSILTPPGTKPAWYLSLGSIFGPRDDPQSNPVGPYTMNAAWVATVS